MSVPSDPEFSLQPADDDSLFGAALDMARAILSPSCQETDPTRRAHYYANLHEIPTDGWFYREIVMESHFHPLTAQIGRHTFFA